VQGGRLRHGVKRGGFICKDRSDRLSSYLAAPSWKITGGDGGTARSGLLAGTIEGWRQSGLSQVLIAVGL